MKIGKDGNILILNFDEGEEITEKTTKLINKLKIKAAFVLNGFGELKEITLFKHGKNEDEKIELNINEDLIITSASGYIALFGKNSELSLTLNLAKKDHSTIGGYVKKAIVKNNATLFIIVLPRTVFEKRFNAKLERFKLGMINYGFEY